MAAVPLARLYLVQSALLLMQVIIYCRGVDLRGDPLPRSYDKANR